MKKFVFMASAILLAGAAFFIFWYWRQPVKAEKVEAGFMVSRDGGANWSRPLFPLPLGRILSDDVYDIFSDSRDPKTVYLGLRNYGVVKSYDGGADWKAVDENNGIKLPLKVFKIAVAPYAPYPVYLAGYQDEFGVVLKSESVEPLFFREVYKTTRKHFGVFDILLDQVRPKRVLIATGEGAAAESMDGGSSWQVLHWFPDSIISLQGNADLSWVTLLTLGGELWVSENGGRLWQKREVSGLTNLDLRSSRTFPVAASAQSFYLATSAGIFLSQKGSTLWVKLRSLFPPKSERRAEAIAVDPRDNKRILAAYGREIYSSHDGGQSWSFVAASKDGTIGTLEFIPGRPEIVFAGLEH